LGYFLKIKGLAVLEDFFFNYEEAKSEVGGIESDPNSKSEPPELDFQG